MSQTMNTPCCLKREQLKVRLLLANSVRSTLHLSNVYTMERFRILLTLYQSSTILTMERFRILLTLYQSSTILTMERFRILLTLYQSSTILTMKRFRILLTLYQSSTILTMERFRILLTLYQSSTILQFTSSLLHSNKWRKKRSINQSMIYKCKPVNYLQTLSLFHYYVQAGH